MDNQDRSLLFKYGFIVQKALLLSGLRWRRGNTWQLFILKERFKELQEEEDQEEESNCQMEFLGIGVSQDGPEGCT